MKKLLIITVTIMFALSMGCRSASKNVVATLDSADEKGSTYVSLIGTSTQEKEGDNSMDIQESTERTTTQAPSSEIPTQDHSSASIEELSQRLLQAFEEFTRTEDSTYPPDIAGTYLDDDELVIILVEGAENPYRELFEEDDPVRFEVAEYAYEELKFMFERLSTILSDWSSIYINMQANAVSVGYTFEYRPDASASSALSGNFTLATYLEELHKGKTTNSLGVPVEELEQYFTPHALESVRIFFEEGNFHD